MMAGCKRNCKIVFAFIHLLFSIFSSSSKSFGSKTNGFSHMGIAHISNANLICAS
jgi:hypothetical protein